MIEIFILAANEIGDYTINGKHLNTPIIEGNKPQCVLCEFIMSKLDEELEDKNTEVTMKKKTINAFYTIILLPEKYNCIDINLFCKLQTC